MKKSTLEGKKFLAVDDEKDVLDVLEEQIMGVCEEYTIEKATTYEKAAHLIESNDFDLVILDIMGVRGFDLLDIAVKKKLRVVMLTAHALNPEALKLSHDMGARSYVPKGKLGEIVQFLEDALTYEFEPGWKTLYRKLRSFYDDVFGADWEKITGIDRSKWDEY
jgi:DNA-binding NtrC family response regulator